MSKSEKIKLWCVGLCSGLLLVASACKDLNSQPNDSDVHFRVGLLALDKENYGDAERAFLTALKTDATNSKIRVHLASVYARQAGVKINDWLDPLQEAGSYMGRRLEWADRNSKPFKPHESDSEEKDYLSTLIHQSISDLLKVEVILEVFRSMPTLSHEQMAKLNQAIEVLRDSSGMTRERAEEVRVYLGVMALVRLFSEVKYLFLDPHSSSTELSMERLCSLKVEAIGGSLREIGTSIQYLKEGLYVKETDAQTSMRKARGALHKVIAEIADQPYWHEMDAAFDAGGRLRPAMEEQLQVACHKHHSG